MGWKGWLVRALLLSRMSRHEKQREFCWVGGVFGGVDAGTDDEAEVDDEAETHALMASGVNWFSQCAPRGGERGPSCVLGMVALSLL